MNNKTQIFSHNRLFRMLLVLASMATTPVTLAQENLLDCKKVDDDLARLACYDRIMVQSGQAQEIVPPNNNTTVASPNVTTSDIPLTGLSESNLWQNWELEQDVKELTFRLLPYHPTYFLPVRYSSNSSSSDSSETSLPVESTEAKFQFSLKTKVWENIIGGNGNLWFAYTQQSYWQIYNSSRSSPLRETNYEPEAMIVFRTNVDALGLRWRILNLGFIHQSNGRESPNSRSWNRLYAMLGLEHKKLTFLARPWWRLSEDADKDDNSDIENYLGNGDLRVIYRSGGYTYALLGRYSNSGHHGALQFDGEFHISGQLKGYLQLFSGYGESLIDYNRFQNVIAIGLLFSPWK